ncbi:hypothetical protein [Brumimicrobium oceani]|uniref:Uncharacterized protein n=1 Tax=Brumimicrobium oceani TaxID=2100725 RepID=A0A2U2X354_9FLAO|nr:hypothetical protein [Brumimicrobium oceani]PWH82215.1 hypothetical protein DIT68_14005 [Brumimicrobium oceani]
MNDKYFINVKLSDYEKEFFKINNSTDHAFGNQYDNRCTTNKLCCAANRKKLIIQSAVHYGRNAGGCWENPGGGSLAAKGDNIRVWTLDNALTKRFTLVETDEQGW